MSRLKPGLAGSVLLLAASAVLLAGCGTEAPHRMGTGTAGGAATGAAFGLIGGPIGVVVGAAVGGGIGALTASTTTPKQINLDNVGKVGPAPGGSYGAAPQTAPAQGYSGPGLRQQINSYQAQPTTAYPQSGGQSYGQSYGQPQSLSPAGGYGGQGVESQPLPPPTVR